MVEIITKEISRATMVEIITKEISRATMVEIITKEIIFRSVRITHAGSSSYIVLEPSPKFVRT